VSAFLNALTAGPPLLMDGAMGTELIRAGLAADGCGVAWNLFHPDRVLAVHRAYRAAGAEVLLTNTFQLNPLALARHGLGDRLDEIGRAAVRLARAAGARFVLGSVGPVLDLPDMTELPDRSLLRPVLDALDGVDGVLFETWSSPRALAAVEYALHETEAGSLPLLLSLAYRKAASGRLETYSGHGPETFARHAARHGVAALGVNCGRDVGPADVVAVVRRYRQECDLPLFARPNAGTDGERSPAELAERVAELVEAGSAMVGGCCGTTPAHIAALKPHTHCGTVGRPGFFLDREEHSQ
jgi:methionine synthase I (cobalamin-dependent)